MGAVTAAPTAGNPAGQWDRTNWDASLWQSTVFPPGAGWGYDWQVWYQYQGRLVWDMTASVVEARWSTDSHTAGDGTFRGDLQPGTLALQVHDPYHQAETLSKLGTIWLHYAPGNFTWGFYLETVTRQLVAPADPTAADVVLQGSPWPLRLSTDCTYQFGRPAERVDTRMTAIATLLSQNANLALPRYVANVASQSQTCAATVPIGDWNTDGTAYPSALSLVRAAAANGVAWVSGAVDGAGIGYFVLNYARWEAGTARNLVQSDIVAGIPYDSSMDDVLTIVENAATGPDGTVVNFSTVHSTVWNYGEAKVNMRTWAAGADTGAVSQTAGNLLTRHGDPTIPRLSAVTATSGLRLHPSGAAGPAWNPAAHVWSPVDIVNWVPPPSQSTWPLKYWVTKTAHRLRAAGWDSAHTLELQTAAIAMAP